MKLFSLLFCCLFVTTVALADNPPLTPIPISSITGKVVRKDGKPVGVIEVMATRVETRGPSEDFYDTQTGTDGTFTFDGLPVGNYSVVIIRDQDADWVPPKAVIVPALTGRTVAGVHIVLDEGGLVEGTVVDSKTSLPVAGVQLYFETISPSSQSNQGLFATTDKNGQYSEHVWAGPVKLTIEYVPPSFVNPFSEPPQTVNVAEDGTVDVNAIKIDEGITVSGRVLRRDGAVTGAVTVRLRRPLSGNAGTEDYVTTTKDDGSYSISGLVPGSYTATVESPVDPSTAQWIAPSPVPFAVTYEAPAVVPDLVLTPGGVITGVVLDAQSGNPVAGVQMSVEVTLPNNTTVEFVNSTTDKAGRFTVHIHPGSAKLTVSGVRVGYADDPVPEETDVTVAEGQTLVVGSIRIDEGITATGKILEKDEKSPGAVIVIASPIAQGKGSEVQTTSSVDGSYELQGMVPGTYTVTVNPLNPTLPPEWVKPEPAALSVVRGSPAIVPDIVLDEGGTITGQVIDAKTLAPIAGVAVSIAEPSTEHPQWSDEDYVTTDAQGRYVAHVRPGDGTIDIDQAPKQYANDRVRSERNYTAVEDQTTTIDPIALEPGISISGRVVLESGGPSGIVIVYIAQQDEQGQGYYGQTQTSAAGTYTLSGLAPGTYLINVQNPGENVSGTWALPAPVKIELTRNKPADVPDLMCDTGAVVTGKVIDSITKGPIPGVQITVAEAFPQDREVRTVTVTTDQNGTYTARVWPGAVNLRLDQVPKPYALGSDTLQSEFKVVDGQAMTIDPIVLEKALSISGQVVDTTGQTVPDIVLNPYVQQNDGATRLLPEITADSAGDFTLSQLSPGNYYVDPGPYWKLATEQTFAVPSSAPVKIIVEKVPLTALQGTVVDDAGAPLPDVALDFNVTRQVIKNSSFSSQTEVSTDKDGFFTLQNAPFDPSEIQLTSATKTGYVLSGGGVVTANGNTLSISLIEMNSLGGVVSGIVKNGLGNAVAGAWVSCATGTGDWRPIQTDNSGHFTLRNLIVGQVDVRAAKGSYYGTVNVATKAAGAGNIVINLAPMSGPVDSTDVVDPTALVSKLLSDSLVNDPGADAWYLRDECAKLLEQTSPTAGVNFLKARTTMNTGDLRWIIQGQLAVNPANTGTWAVPLLLNIPDNGYGLGLASSMARQIAPYDPADANLLYNWINTKFPSDPIDLVGLAYVLHRPEADPLYQKVLGIIQFQSVNPTPDPGGGTDTGATGMQQDLAVAVAPGNPTAARQLLTALPAENKISAVSEIVSELSASDPASALDFFHMLDPDKITSEQDMGRYDQSLDDLLPIIAKTDPKSATSLANAVSEPHDRAVALTIVADLLPISDAEPLYREAEAVSTDYANNDGGTPASVAAHALLRNRALGVELFAAAFDKVMSSPPGKFTWDGPSYAEFAFYYSRVDPGYSRLLLENVFRKDLGPSENVWGDTGPLPDLAAMAAIDPERAKELAGLITDPDDRFSARERVVQYLLSSQETRDTLPFDKWFTNWEWQPGEKSPW